MSIELTTEEILFVKNLVARSKSEPESDIDGPNGNPTVRKDPKFINFRPYTGPSFVGCKYSECPSDYLLGLASFFEWSASKDKAAGEAARKSDKGVFYWTYAEKDAQRARAWAARNKGKVIEAPAPVEVPFDEVNF